MSGARGDYLNSTQRAAQAIARAVLEQDTQVRLPTAQEYQLSLGVGSGTVQKAFSLLEDAGALMTRSRGHHGRFVTSADLNQLWRLSMLPPVRAILTPPGAAEVYGLVDALVNEFSEIGVPLEIDYVRGGERRLAAASASPTAFAVMSTSAAADAAHGDTDVRVAMTLGAGTYYAPGSVVVVSRPDIADIAHPRVGIDRGSLDNMRLTAAELGPLDGLDLVDCAFPTIPRMILSDQIDIGVWHRMMLLITPELAGLVTTELSPFASATAADLSEAAIIVPASNRAVANVLSGMMPGRIMRTQAEAVTQLSASIDRTWLY